MLDAQYMFIALGYILSINPLIIKLTQFLKMQYWGEVEAIHRPFWCRASQELSELLQMLLDLQWGYPLMSPGSGENI